MQYKIKSISPTYFKVFYCNIENWVTIIREKYNRVPRIREFGFLQVHTGYLTFSLKKLHWCHKIK